MPIELLWIGAILLVMGAGAAVLLVPWESLLGAGYSMGVYAVVAGVPMELIYFAALAWLFRGRGKEVEGWIWRSFAFHHLLTPAQKWFVLPWFYFGALAFLGASLGIVLVFLGALAAIVV